MHSAFLCEGAYASASTHSPPSGNKVRIRYTAVEHLSDNLGLIGREGEGGWESIEMVDTLLSQNGDQGESPSHPTQSV